MTVVSPKNLSLFSLSLLGIAMMLLMPQSALAASKQYALGCVTGGHVVISKDKTFDCSSGGHEVVINGIGTAKQAAANNTPYTNTQELTLVTVDCGSGKTKTPALGAVVQSDTFCSGTPKSVKKVASTSSAPNPIPAAKNPTVTSYGTDSGGNTIGGSTPSSSTSCNGSCSDPAADPKNDCNNKGCDLTKKYINPLVNLLSVIFGLIAVISIIVGSIQYAASAGDPQKTSAAKQRIVNTMIAIMAYLFLYAFLQFLIPGGLFNTGAAP